MPEAEADQSKSSRTHAACLRIYIPRLIDLSLIAGNQPAAQPQDPSDDEALADPGQFSMCQNPEFPIQQSGFPIKNPDFLSKNPGFLLKNVDFIIKKTGAGC